MALDARLQFALQPPDFVGTFARGNALATQVRNAPILDQLLQQRATQGQQTIQGNEQAQAFVLEKIKGDLAQGLLDRKGDERRAFLESSIGPLTGLGIPREDLASIRINDDAFLKGMVDRAASFDRFGGNQSVAGQDFRRLISGMSPEKQTQAREVRAGVAARPVSPQIQMIGGVPHKFDRNTGTMEPVEVGGKTVTPETVAADTGIISEGDEAGTLRAQLEGKPQIVAATARALSEEELRAAAPDQITAMDAQIVTIDAVIEEVELALKLVGPTTTGLIGARTAFIEGTDAFSLAAKIETIQARLGFKELQDMRNASKSGGALGQVSERELTLLTAALVSLKQGLPEPDLRRSFQKVIKHYNNWKANTLKIRAKNVKLLGKDPSSITEMTDEEIMAELNAE